MQLKHCCTLLILLMLLSVNSQLVMAQPVPHSPMILPPILTPSIAADVAARTGRIILKDLVTDRNARMLGFLNSDEASKAQLGVPFPTYFVNLSDLRNFDPANSKVSDLIKPMHSYLYPLVTDRMDGAGAKARSAVVVSQRQDKNDPTKIIWKATNWGLALLTDRVTEYRATVAGFASGFILWFPSLNLHFLGNQLSNENILLIPLADRPAYGLKKGQPISAQIVFALYALEAKVLDDKSPG